MVKSGARYIAITSGPISAKPGKTILVGVVFRETYVEGLLSTKVTIQGTDSTAQITKMIKRSKFNDQIKVLLFNGIALAGLNIINPKELEEKLKMKVVLLNKRKQNAKELIHAIKMFSKRTKTNATERIKIVKEHSRTKILKTDGIFLQSNLDIPYLKRFASKAFEAIRISHIISSGISKGESKGRL